MLATFFLVHFKLSPGSSFHCFQMEIVKLLGSIHVRWDGSLRFDSPWNLLGPPPMPKIYPPPPRLWTVNMYARKRIKFNFWLSHLAVIQLVDGLDASANRFLSAFFRALVRHIDNTIVTQLMNILLQNLFAQRWRMRGNDPNNSEIQQFVAENLLE